MGENRKKTKETRLRVVIDTSVLFSGAISTRGYAFEVLELLATGGKITNYISSKTLKEYEEKLYSKKALRYISLEEAKGYIQSMKALSKRVQIKRSFQKSKTILEKVRDPKDIPFLDVVYNAKADVLITYDRKHLLRIRNKEKKFKLGRHEFYILTPKEFIEFYKK
ncbi:putative toxin-antitoxin system toxin component, PIN family [Thermococcus sp. JCM 11816]|uniref:putative toxin-antitoxin system toxin component, PIN family n=1 Tax=Thermococcus sp. (strain JCM 11816 / KS-1) TaxID=1295125 RepID=UPI0006D20633